ncbi:6-phosphogluconolactonase [Candidatus Similichlamydia laticola]|uniref:6-phosphogluconolactonase n=1 Tax=Candidatus Similichlamydia laticola TaxID=2170265 RepID=A0A369KFB5_9BACT|nr:6-phosphogluconolactonase [Candidatus Similichlamydia laticola]RDB31587.1 6-phosphogluconolactonase, eukaryotic type [Candidatus Similichlamydia laticola]
MRYSLNGMDLIVPGTLKETVEWTVQAFLTYAQSSINASGLCKVALSGGKTPLVLFEAFAQISTQELWKGVEWFWNDERYVPIGHQKSNFGNAFHSLKALKGSSFFPMVHDELLPPQQEALLYAKRIGDKLPFDLSLLGLGEDGHIASLFPNHDVFLRQKEGLEKGEDDQMPLVEAFSVPGEGWRISLSLSPIVNSSSIWVFITGKEKSSIVKRVLCDEDTSLPARLLVGRKNVLFILDQDAFSSMDL